MARVRMLWPDHRSHRKVGALDDRPYRTWIGMILEADDDGRVLVDPVELRTRIFAARPRVTIAHVKADVRTLARVGLIRLYQSAGIHYAHFPSWKDWQHPRYPTASKLPSPPPMARNSATVESPMRQPSRTRASRVRHGCTPGGVGRSGMERGGMVTVKPTGNGAHAPAKSEEPFKAIATRAQRAAARRERAERA